MFETASKGGEGEGAASRIANYVSIFSGGSLSQSTIFGLGVMPYISSSIIFQLLGTVVPVAGEAAEGRRDGPQEDPGMDPLRDGAAVHHPGGVLAEVPVQQHQPTRLVQKEFLHDSPTTFWVMGIICLTAGSIFLMWLGEQIDEYGLGNGISLLILAGIVARMPQAITLLVSQTDFNATADPAKLGIGDILFLLFSFVFVIAGSILITQAQRRIPVQQAKHTRGRRVYGGGKQYLPLRVNHGGVMPIIFAQSLMLFPGVIFDYLDSHVNAGGAPTGSSGTSSASSTPSSSAARSSTSWPRSP